MFPKMSITIACMLLFCIYFLMRMPEIVWSSVLLSGFLLLCAQTKLDNLFFPKNDHSFKQLFPSDNLYSAVSVPIK